jgi:hypothetical protein
LRVSPSAFVVTGCGRSGTGYAAALLSAVGRQCGHEAIFRPDTDDVPATFRAPVGDASWLAAPFIPRLPPATVVVHLVRDPLEVARSHLGIGFFSTRPQPPAVRLQNAVELARRSFGMPTRRYVRADFRRFLERHDPDIFRGRGELARCIRYWVRWNELVERGVEEARLPYMRMAVERIDAETLTELLARIGSSAGPDHIGDVLAEVPRATNTRARDERLGQAELQSADTDGSLAKLAERYGYEA